MSAQSSHLYASSGLNTEGQIRLLTVYPDIEGSQEISCKLEVVHLEENPSYTAVSYTWGSPINDAPDRGAPRSTTTHPIICNGNTALVTKNLYDFLQRVRCEQELNSRKFWIDSLCINQHDVAERGSQVGLMASIYGSAEMVIAWLGEEDIHTKEAFTLVTILGTLCEECLGQITPNNVDTEAFVNILGPLADKHAWDSLRQIWQRSYFKRAWIIQELALAKKVITKCGGHFLSWNHIVRVSTFLTLTAWVRVLNVGSHELADWGYSNHVFPLYINSNRKMVSLGKHFDLLHILSKARRFQCSDPRDKVYALLGLLGDHVKQKPRLQPVYENRSVVETYVSTATQILEDADDLLLLGHVEGEDFQVIEGLPSWVPDWSCGKGVGLGIVGYKRFAASGKLPRNLTIDELNLSLILSGLQLDRVVQVGESKDEALTHRNLAYFPGWLSILSALPAVYHTGQPKTEVFWRTLITDTAARAFQPPRHPAAYEYGAAFRSWCERIILRWINESQYVDKRHFLEGISQLAALDTPNDILEKGLVSSPLDELANTDNSVSLNADDYDAILSHSSQTRLLRTNANYLGLATTSVKVDDLVWIMSGSRVPLILRESNNINEYRLVGGAYVHGIMQGEALVPDAALIEIKIV